MKRMFIPIFLLSLAACGGDPPSPEDAFENLTVPVASLDGTEITLEGRRAASSDGTLTFLMDDLHLIGDLDQNGIRVMSGVLFITRPGSPTLAELVVAVEEDGDLVHRASHPLGEGLRVEGVRYDAGEIVVHLLFPTPEDPPCCPSRSVVQRFRLTGSTLTPVIADA